MTAARIPLRIDITSDTICPFCFVGLRKLEKALATPSAAKLDARIRFLPYQLDPRLPLDHALNKRDMYAAKFGPERVGAIEAMMAERGREVGINFSYGGTVRSTLNSHRLIEKAYAVGGSKLQLALINALFHAYFENEQDPGSLDMLSSAAASTGVFPSADEARTFLQSDELTDTVKQGFQTAYQKGITGVPHFELEAGEQTSPFARAEIPGAQDPQVFENVFKQMVERAATVLPTTSADEGATCSLDGGDKC